MKKIQSIELHGDGLINQTFLITLANKEQFILQKINTKIFKDPSVIMTNIQTVRDHLIRKNYTKRILETVPTQNGKLFFNDGKNAWRVFEYIKHTYTVNKLDDPQQAYEIAKCIGNFLAYLIDLKPTKITPGIPNFHNIQHTYLQYKKSIPPKMNISNWPDTQKLQEIYDTLEENSTEFNHFVRSHSKSKLPTRIIHGDPKPNNILLSKLDHQAIAVIDLDTLMPSWVIFDFGDMVRSYTNSVDENHITKEDVKMRFEYFEAMSKGFLDQLSKKLTYIEKNNLVNGAILIVYEQALRFITDYFNGNSYYKVNYKMQNLDRTHNQITLLKSILEQREKMKDLILKM